MTNLYDFTVKAQDGTDISLSKYQGKVLLVVNTATGCGLTPQYEGLQNLYDTYHDKGFEILDFPCNQFMNQAPGTADEINTFCTLNYQTTFPRFAKIKINGKEVKKIMVDGKEFFGGDVKTGLKNLPVNMIDKLKTYDKKIRLGTCYRNR